MGIERFYGYNRHDYYYPRSSREAFGSHFEAESEVRDSWLEVVGFVVALTALLIVLGLYAN